MRSVPLKAVQELLGHGTLEMTMRCEHLRPDARWDAVGVLDLPAPDRTQSPDPANNITCQPASVAEIAYENCGGAGSRTRVRKRSVDVTTCVARDLGFRPRVGPLAGRPGA